MEALGIVSLRPASRNRSGKRVFPSAGPISVIEPAPPVKDGAALAVVEVEELKGRELGLKVAREVMGWRLVSDAMMEAWVDGEGELTGYYNGHPFSPYRDRNALEEVWHQVEHLGLQTVYSMHLSGLLSSGNEEGIEVDRWMLHTCRPETACRAALLAVRLS